MIDVFESWITQNGQPLSRLACLTDEEVLKMTGGRVLISSSHRCVIVQHQGLRNVRPTFGPNLEGWVNGREWVLLEVKEGEKPTEIEIFPSFAEARKEALRLVRGAAEVGDALDKAKAAINQIEKMKFNPERAVAAEYALWESVIRSYAAGLHDGGAVAEEALKSLQIEFPRRFA